MSTEAHDKKDNLQGESGNDKPVSPVVKDESLETLEENQTGTEISDLPPSEIAPGEPAPPLENPAPVVETKKPPVESAPTPSNNSGKWAKRFTATVNFSGERGRILSEMVKKGVEEGYWESPQHFFNKVVDFAINSQLVHAHLNVTDAYIFGVPDSVQTKLFINGYYENDSNLKLEVCQ